MIPDEIAKCMPDEVVEAAAFYLPGYHSKDLHNHVRAAIAAARAAWPRMAKLEARLISPSGLFPPLKQEGA